jgi:hypothetical protein
MREMAEHHKEHQHQPEEEEHCNDCGILIEGAHGHCPAGDE